MQITGFFEDKMPFKSKAQQKYLFLNEPEVARKFAKETPKKAYKKLPEHVKTRTAHGRDRSVKKLASRVRQNEE